ncbi:hypothetical protein WK68_12970 [Burkholderia ubonensis]|uniref:glycosyltransferase family 2 protein n=1 Tax=Burkholderia ubonensis TaxID=101571 RepID=UPI000753FC2E|nr:glycosyltransferase family 2 protein [Burkholderia ubonensis]KVU40927.1 hypothetical protein WK68_12970 [Burkholderia ubonensis]
MPLVSVILPVFNGAQHITQSIASIVNQSLRDFELIIVNDGSTDRTRERIEEVKDSRIRYVELAQNKGTAFATQTGYELSTGKYLVFQDADDVSDAARLETQARVMNGQPRTTVLGSAMDCFDGSTQRLTVPLDDGNIKVRLLAGAGNIYNPTAMIRQSFIDKHALGWRAEHGSAFDWAFYVDVMMYGGKFANLAAPLVRYRVHDAQQSKDLDHCRPIIATIRQRIMARFFPELTAHERATLEPLLQWAGPPPLAPEAVAEGLAILERAEQLSASALGENRATLANYLKQCRKRWTQALDVR